MNLQETRQTLERTKGRKEQLGASLKATELRVGSLRRTLRNLEQAQTIIQTVAQQTQAELEYHVSELVTLALGAVFEEDPYAFKVEFIQRRGRTEADLLFLRGDVTLDPLTASGGGAVDVAAFALRVALWRLQNPRSRNVLALDEPFKMIDRTRQPRAARLLKELSAKLGLQIIMVSHSPDLIEEADKVFTVTKRKNVSEVV